ncbi:hypothetical protein [Massilia sp. YIM B04103]|nr:hypothetical protein [Massilia sp. YIM B04103]
MIQIICFSKGGDHNTAVDGVVRIAAAPSLESAFPETREKKNEQQG